MDSLISNLAKTSPSSASAVFSFFVVVLGLMHVLVLFRVGHKWFWTVIEYMWLTLASLSVISMVGEYRRLSANEELSSARTQLELAWAKANTAADECVEYYKVDHDHGFSHPEVPEQEVEDAWTKSRFWCEELRTALDLGPSVKNMKGWRRYVNSAASSPFPELEADNLNSQISDDEYRRRFERRLAPGNWFHLRMLYDSRRSNAASAVDSYAKIASHVQELESASTRTPLERSGLAIGPWLLIMGLALRISKVSAGLRGLC